jgi:signal transduction histidine kinase
MFYHWIFMERKEIQLLIISLGIVFFTLLVVLVVLFLYFLKKKNKFMFERMESEHYFQSELIKTRIEIKDQTLSEISKELHDNIGQILSVAIMQLNLFLQNDKKIVSQKELIDLKDIVTNGLDEIRILSRIINKENTLHCNFIDSIKLDLDKIKKLKKIKCIFNWDGISPVINFEHELFIYRIFQEAIHNSLKHSHSEVFEISIATTKDDFSLNLTDFGIGYDLNLLSSGSGLTNMKLRAKLIGASIEMNSNNNGTAIKLVYPLNSNNEINF